jgi:hypothetical protein
MDAMRPRHFYRVIDATIIDNQPFDLINAGDGCRKFGKRTGQGFRFVQTGYLNNEFHQAASF